VPVEPGLNAAVTDARGAPKQHLSTRRSILVLRCQPRCKADDDADEVHIRLPHVHVPKVLMPAEDVRLSQVQHIASRCDCLWRPVGLHQSQLEQLFPKLRKLFSIV
jgi:hypothetical protein